MRKPKHTLIIDVAHLLFRIAFMQNKDKGNQLSSPGDMVAMCMHVAFQSSQKLYRKYNPDFIVYAFEGGNNWRKEYTKANNTRVGYKASRVPDPALAYMQDLMTDFYETLKNHTSISCIKIPGMEADDVIAAYCQEHSAEDHTISIISSDKDYTQLLKLAGVRLIDPITEKLRNQPNDKDYTEDLDYWLFLKCVRGDKGDDVLSAFPRVRETRVKKAYEDDFERVNFMNEEWTLDNVTYKVGDLYEENKILMSLYDQPPHIREQLLVGLEEQLHDIKSYSHFHFLRFCNKYNLKRLAEDSAKYVNLLSNNTRFLNGEKDFAAPKDLRSTEQKVADAIEANRAAAKRTLQF